MWIVGSNLFSQQLLELLVFILRVRGWQNSITRGATAAAAHCNPPGAEHHGWLYRLPRSVVFSLRPYFWEIHLGRIRAHLVCKVDPSSPGGYQEKGKQKWPFIVDLPIKNGDFP
jgi:hypothetical protein